LKSSDILDLAELATPIVAPDNRPNTLIAPDYRWRSFPTIKEHIVGFVRIRKLAINARFCPDHVSEVLTHALPFGFCFIISMLFSCFC
jgi:hypothetical protein